VTGKTFIGEDGTDIPIEVKGTLAEGSHGKKKNVEAGAHVGLHV
jgi:hypothetical protein